MSRRFGPIFYLCVNLALAACVVWLAIGRLALGPAIALAAGLACIQIGLWVAMMRGREPRVPQETRLASVIGRTAHTRRFSIRDETTGLLNRWYLERRLGEEAARCKRYGYSMSVIVLKAVVPHAEGMSLDNWQVKSADAAQRCLAVVRNVDLSAVLGPFEFAICLVHCDRSGAEAARARLVSELSEYECLTGIAVLPDDDIAPGAMVEMARSRSHGVELKKSA
jgi:GGDEF domain-containing protein